ncbi:hypothetical protein [Salsipaludibacter albus]|uniref:hypothetical protein n=1 Tax=Salsipaludibacter albus TaxID=2849650 RepID=UPI001EE4034E|nr:hypothetical protein [Salsipaludibacter albus]MBY5164147.1 hypothetical protein [Salsipaludibacter albus]
MATKPQEWIEVSATVPSSHVGSLTVHIGEWLYHYDTTPGNVRHLLPGGPREPDHVDVTFVLPADKVEPFYCELANWWRRVHEEEARDADGDATSPEDLTG